MTHAAKQPMASCQRLDRLGWTSQASATTQCPVQANDRQPSALGHIKDPGVLKTPLSRIQAAKE